VGERHGKPVVLRVKSGEMFRAGQLFYLSENGVWLTEKVDAEFLEFPT
jgi:putative RNA 2'-phosphotransferase